MKNNIILDRSFAFAVEIIYCTDWMRNELREFVLSKQLLRCGTSIGANVEEAAGGVSRADFINKMQIAYKESRETTYWLRLMKATKKLPKDKASRLLSQADELVRIIAAILKSSKSPTALNS